MLDWDNPKKVNHSDSWILNKIGNLCGRIGNIVNKPYYRWGTFWSVGDIDFQEDIDREEQS